MSDEPRIRDLYRQYEEGRLSFEDVIRAANRVLDRFAAEQTSTPPAQSQPQAAGRPRQH